MQSTSTSDSQTISLNELRSTWLNAETSEKASTVLGKLMDETHVNSVAAFLGLMNRDFGCSVNSDTTGPGAIALLRDKIGEMGDGESMESKDELCGLLMSFRAGDYGQHHKSLLKALTNVDTTLKPIWHPHGNWDTFVTAAKKTLPTVSLRTMVDQMERAFHPEDSSDTSSEDDDDEDVIFKRSG